MERSTRVANSMRVANCVTCDRGMESSPPCRRRRDLAYPASAIRARL